MDWNDNGGENWNVWKKTWLVNIFKKALLSLNYFNCTLSGDRYPFPTFRGVFAYTLKKRYDIQRMGLKQIIQGKLLDLFFLQQTE